MAKYFLHIAYPGGEILKDVEGQVFLTSADARSEAIEVAKEIVVESIRFNGRLGLDRSIVIADERGSIIEELSFSSLFNED